MKFAALVVEGEGETELELELELEREVHLVVFSDFMAAEAISGLSAIKQELGTNSGISNKVVPEWSLAPRSPTQALSSNERRDEAA